MCNLCNQTPTLSNIAEFAETQNIATDTLLLLNKERFPGWSKITKC
jgi:hypothetical protein